MRKQNCWEFKNCGRDKMNKYGICPAATEVKAHGVNGGINGGRVCWKVTGTYCYGTAEGAYAEKLMKCAICDFRLKVQEEESYKFKYIYF